jgi:hypothetical protein
MAGTEVLFVIGNSYNGRSTLDCGQISHPPGYRYKVPNNKVPNNKVPNHKVPKVTKFLK